MPPEIPPQNLSLITQQLKPPPLHNHNTLFLDRDGVINEQIIGGYVLDYDREFVFKPGVIKALQLLRPQFRHLILVTNQQCVGKRLCTADDIRRVHERMQAHLGAHGCALDGIYTCPHLASDNCSCRKPAIGMALQAQCDFHGIDFHQAFMVGDSLSDLQFACNAGITPVHIGDFHQAEQEIRQLTQLHFDTLLDFALHITTKPTTYNS